MNILDYPFDNSEILKRKKALRRQLMEKIGFIEKRIAILSGSTIGDIKDILEIFLLNYGIKPTFYIGQYNRFYEDIMFDNTKLINFEPDIIYIHTSIINTSNDKILDNLQAIWIKIREMFKCVIIQNNFEIPRFGNTDMVHKINILNIHIAEYAKHNKDFYINDILYQSAYFGLEEWYDEQSYFLYKYAFNIKAIPLICHNIAKIIKSIYGKNQKCLILDLDNTLWGGVVGEIGISGIELGMETALGEAYVNFQRYVKTLHDMGIVLAVCSKNNEQIAKEAFNNPNMILQLNDIAVFCANWDNKADNIMKIASQLNILLESIVFIDDNPAERDLIKKALPEVKVPDVNSVIDFIKHIEEAGYFYNVCISGDDKKRNEYYIADLKRNEVKDTFNDYGKYLSELQMSSKIQSINSLNLDRIVQLINKTNQFNLTTKRYTISEIEKIMIDSNYITRFATLDDKFGRNGIVSVLIGEIVQNTIYIRLWVMSCRVFKRDLELAMYDNFVQMCKIKGFEKIVGFYFKTKNNGYVSNLLKDLGFIKITDDTWEFDLNVDYVCKNKYIQIEGMDNANEL